MPLLDSPRPRRTGRRIAAAGLLAVAAISPVVLHRSPALPAVIDGPYARLLAQSTDLGPDRDHPVRIVAALTRPAMPERLSRWARLRDMTVHWRPGDSWAILEGAPEAVATAFAVSIHRYVARDGALFDAAAQQPGIPSAAADEEEEEDDQEERRSASRAS